MAGAQFNLRVRPELAQAVRLEAARRGDGSSARDIIEELIAAAPWATIAGTPPAEHPELPFTPPDPAQRADDPGPPSPGEAADQRAGDARAPRGRTRKDRADTAGEAGKSGQRRGRGAAAPSEPAAPEPVPDLAAALLKSLQRGCPECGGNAEERADHQAFVCDDCGHAWAA